MVYVLEKRKPEGERPAIFMTAKASRDPQEDFTNMFVYKCVCVCVCVSVNVSLLIFNIATHPCEIQL